MHLKNLRSKFHVVFSPQEIKGKNRYKETFGGLIVVMASWMYIYVQTHQIVYIKYEQFFSISIISN